MKTTKTSIRQRGQHRTPDKAGVKKTATGASRPANRAIEKNVATSPERLAKLAGLAPSKSHLRQTLGHLKSRKALLHDFGLRELKRCPCQDGERRGGHGHAVVAPGGEHHRLSQLCGGLDAQDVRADPLDPSSARGNQRLDAGESVALLVPQHTHLGKRRW